MILGLVPTLKDSPMCLPGTQQHWNERLQCMDQ